MKRLDVLEEITKLRDECKWLLKIARKEYLVIPNGAVIVRGERRVAALNFVINQLERLIQADCRHPHILGDSQMGKCSMCGMILYTAPQQP